MFGYSDSAPDTSVWGASVMDFCGDSLQIYEIDRPMDFRATNASISDDEGSLLFYTNGNYIANRLHQPMPNGTNLWTPGTTGWYDDGVPVPQGIIILPWPENPGKYFVFYGRSGGVYVENQLTLGNLGLFYALVDMSLDNGLGAVVAKNVAISTDTLKNGRLTATRHANGRDWWLVAGKLHSQQLVRFLITPEGIINYGAVSQDIFIKHGLGQAVFSPDGAFYADVSLYKWRDNYVTFLGFDRCTGEFTSLGQFHYTDNDGLAGVAISPNSRYVYHPSTYIMRRFDLWADDIVASMDTVAVNDGYRETISGIPFTLPVIFYLAQLAPNGKIYVISSNTVRSMHVVEYPDEHDCQVTRHSPLLPKLSTTLPNFPNYRLGALPGSPCDTLGVSGIGRPASLVKAVQVYLLPNPAQDYFILAMEHNGRPLSVQPLRLRVYNSTGQAVLQHELPAGMREHRIDTRHLPAGMYYVSLQYEGRVLKTEKLILVK